MITLLHRIGLAEKTREGKINTYLALLRLEVVIRTLLAGDYAVRILFQYYIEVDRRPRLLYSSVTNMSLVMMFLQVVTTDR